MLNSVIAKVVGSLDFQEDRRAELRDIALTDWPALLEWTDRAQLTLPLGVRCREHLPGSVRDRIDRNLAGNAARYDRLLAEYHSLASALRSQSIDFIQLKGFSQIAPFYVLDPRHRPQYDIDLYCPAESLDRAWDALVQTGFIPVARRRKRTDHLPALIRDWNWQWRGDYYATDLPLTVELHFRFWDFQTERLPAPYVGQFWPRRTSRMVDGIELPMLSLADSVSYSALHLMRHLLRGDLRIYHVYELAHFLHQTERNDELWNQWRDHHAADSPIVETVAFRLATEWFACRTHPIVCREIEALPPNIARWFALFRDSPLRMDRPNKDELFLHLSLLSNPFDQCAVTLRRLFPFPARPAMREPAFVVQRILHHLRTSALLMQNVCRWVAHPAATSRKSQTSC